MAGADGFGPPVAESESAALPLGEAPIKLVRMKRFELLRAMPGDSESPVSSISTTLANWQELMESNHRARIWNPLFSH